MKLMVAPPTEICSHPPLDCASVRNSPFHLWFLWSVKLTAVRSTRQHSSHTYPPSMHHRSLPPCVIPHERRSYSCRPHPPLDCASVRNSPFQLRLLSVKLTAVRSTRQHSSHLYSRPSMHHRSLPPCLNPRKGCYSLKKHRCPASHPLCVSPSEPCARSHTILHEFHFMQHDMVWCVQLESKEHGCHLSGHVSGLLHERI